MGIETSPVEMHPDLESVLLPADVIQHRIRQLGEEISEDLSGDPIHLVGVLRGALPFLADLMRAIRAPVTMDLISVGSYGAGARSTGVVRIVKDLEDSIEGRTVLLVEDIVDTGLTLAYLRDLLADRHAAEIRICTFLDKPDARVRPIHLDYVGFTVPNRFVVGFGLDYAQRYRELPYVGILRPEIYTAGHRAEA